jgi:lipid II:glycine glycyltransferase (peptidoglycan interpeptide bridge formation enzyme)
MKWKYWNGNKIEWDNLLLSTIDYTVFQSYNWGEYNNSKWKTIRYYCLNKNSEVIALAQLFVKKLPFKLSFIWVPGGPVFCFKNNNSLKLTNLISEFVEKISIDYPNSLIRFDKHERHNSLFSYNINKTCLRPIFKINSGYTVKFIFEENQKDFRNKMSTKHRYYTKKSSESNIEWKIGNENQKINDLINLHEEMSDNKNLSYSKLNYDDIKKMIEKFNDKVLILVGYINNSPVTACLVIIFNQKANYMHAATNEKGRTTNAAYSMFEKLACELLLNNVIEFDFGGIDPINPKSSGVNHFKCGFGGEVTELIGEWEYSRNNYVRYIINLLIRLKK